MIPVLLFPQFDPVIVHIGPFGIRWYALAYIAGLVLGWRLLRYLVQQPPAVATAVQADDFLTWATLGVVLGGRLGYVLFYQPSVYLAHPGMIFAVWEGGMSFHGGALGMIVAIIWFCRRNAIPLLGFADRVVVAVPIGLCFGRIANFINGELWGRPAPDWLPWAMIFPNGGPVPRHPSQLYESLLEGAVLFVVMFALSRQERLRARFGWLSGAFLIGYGDCTHHRRILPRARRVSGIPDRRRDHGSVAVHTDADRGGVADPAQPVMERLDHFMARANAAYYATHDPYRDFTTSPEISQVFGEILGLWAAVTWELMGRPDPVLLVEAGPGRGTLMADALRAIARGGQGVSRGAAPASDRDVAPAAGDPGGTAAWRDLARRSGHAAGWAAAVAGQRISRCAADPAVRPARRDVDGEVRGGWALRGMPRSAPSPAPLPQGEGEQAATVAAPPPLAGGGRGEGAAGHTIYELNEPALAIARSLGSRLSTHPGAALFLDYGPEHSAPGDSLQAVSDGRPADPLAPPGTADLTAHVDFAAFAAAARGAGAAIHGPVPQGLFLARLGLFQRTDRLARTQPPARASALIEAARRLAEPNRMGRLFKALALCNPACPTPPGFEG